MSEIRKLVDGSYMSSVIKVCFLTPGFPSNERDKNCFPYIQDFLIEMVEKSGPQHVTAIGIHYPFKREQYIWNGITVYAIGGENNSGFTKLKTWLRVLKTLNKIYLNEGIDVIHAVWLNEPAFLAQIFSWFFPVKIVVTVPGQDAKKTNRYLRFLNLGKMHVSGLSQFVINELQKHQKLKSYGVIPSGIRNNIFQPADESTVGFDILGVGNIHPLKNYGLFLDVVNMIKKNRPEIQAAIIGWGKEELQLLKAKCKELDLGKNVRFLGELERHNVIAIMSKSKVFLHTSNYEGQGFVFTEALSRGMSVVSTPVADNRQIEPIRTGDNAEELALLVNEALAGFNRQVILLKSAGETADDYIKLYNSLKC